MQRRVAYAVSLALAVTALAGPAGADGAEATGASCGLNTRTDPTGLISQDPYTHFGEIHCGPFAAADLLADDRSGPSPHPQAARIRICGWAQVNDDEYGVPSPPRVVCGEGTGVAVAAGLVSYQATPTDNVYLCTEITLTHAATTRVIRYDDDLDPGNGAQCGLAVSAGP